MRIRIKNLNTRKKPGYKKPRFRNVKKYKYFTKTMYTENQALKIICLTANDMEMMV